MPDAVPAFTLIVVFLAIVFGFVWSKMYSRWKDIVDCEPPEPFGLGSYVDNARAGNEARRVLHETRELITARRANNFTNRMESLDFLLRREKKLLSVMRFFRVPETVEK